MLGPHFLSLALVRLKARQKWVASSAGLTFIFPEAGSGECLWRKGLQPLEPGDVLVLNPASGGRVKLATRRKFLFWFFTLNLEYLFPLFDWKEIVLLPGINDLLKGVTLFPASSLLSAKCHRLLRDVPHELDLNHRSQLLRIAGAILSAQFENAQPRRSGLIRMDGRMRRIFDKLSTDEILTLPVTELARRINYSRRRLTRLFHQWFGCSVLDLRMEIRLLRAVSLLRNPELTVGAVAQQSGFEHMGLFNQCFKRRFGSTPGQWRTAALKVESRRTDPINAEPNCPLLTDGLCPWSAKLS
jgi:AraC-like DNA-binding protein